MSASADVIDAAKEELATVKDPLIPVFNAKELDKLLGTTLVATANELVAALIVAISSVLAIILLASDADVTLNEPDICVFKAKELVTLLIDPEIAFFKA